MEKKLNAYETTACSFYNKIEEITTNLEKIYISELDYLIQLSPDIDCYLYTGVGIYSNTPNFNHPITFKHDGKIITIGDARPYIKLNNNSVVSSTNFAISDSESLEYLRTRVKTQHIWATDIPTVFMNFSKLPLVVYSNLLSDHIARRLALDPRDILTITCLAAVLYLNQFDTGSEDTKTKAVHMSAKISEALSIRQPLVYESIMNNIDIKNVTDFCEACKTQTNNVRLNELNPITLFGIIGPNWFGHNGKELINCALEHPPTWVSLLYRAINSRGYNNSGLSKFMERGVFRKLSADYSRQFNHLLKRI